MSMTHDGGKPMKRDLPYSPPQGPKHMSDVGPGLHSNNYGNCGTQCGGGTRAETSGTVRTGMTLELPQGKH